jgi:uncharacterized membrane protein
MLVNPSGLVGHWMGADLNIEHLIGFLKVHRTMYLVRCVLTTMKSSFYSLRKVYMQVGNVSAIFQQQ